MQVAEEVAAQKALQAARSSPLRMAAARTPAACTVGPAPPLGSPPQQMLVADPSDASLGPVPAADPGTAAVSSSPPLAAQAAAQTTASALPAPSRGGVQLPRGEVTAASGEAAQWRVQQEGDLPGHADYPASAAPQQVAPRRSFPQQPADADHVGVDDGDMQAGDPDAAPSARDAAAAALDSQSALRKAVRLLLVPQAGCARAVPQHAVALMASLRGTNAATCSGAGFYPTIASVPIPRPLIVAACWQHHAEQRGCARAVSRAAVTSLVDLLRRAGARGEPSQVSLLWKYDASRCWPARWRRLQAQMHVLALLIIQLCLATKLGLCLPIWYFSAVRDASVQLNPPNVRCGQVEPSSWHGGNCSLTFGWSNHR